VKERGWGSTCLQARQRPPKLLKFHRCSGTGVVLDDDFGEGQSFYITNTAIIHILGEEEASVQQSVHSG
jgi:hypothetical protein